MIQVKLLNGDLLLIEGGGDESLKNTLAEYLSVPVDTIVLRKVEDENNMFECLVLARPVVVLTEEETEKVRDWLLGKHVRELRTACNKSLLDYAEQLGCDLSANPKKTFNAFNAALGGGIFMNPSEECVDYVLSLDVSTILPEYLHLLVRNPNARILSLVVSYLRENPEKMSVLMTEILSRHVNHDTNQFIWDTFEKTQIESMFFFWTNPITVEERMLPLFREGRFLSHICYAGGTQNEDLLREFVIPEAEKMLAGEQCQFLFHFFDNPNGLAVDWFLEHISVIKDRYTDIWNNPNERIVRRLLADKNLIINDIRFFRNPSPIVKEECMRFICDNCQELQRFSRDCADWDADVLVRWREKSKGPDVIELVRALSRTDKYEIVFHE